MKVFSKIMGILLLIVLAATMLFGLIFGGIMVASGAGITNGGEASSLAEALAKGLGGVTFLVIGLIFLGVGIVSIIPFVMILVMTIQRGKGKNTVAGDWIIAIFNVAVIIAAIVIAATEKDSVPISIVMIVLALLCELYVIPDMVGGMKRKKALKQGKGTVTKDLQEAPVIAEDDADDGDDVEYETITKG